MDSDGGYSDDWDGDATAGSPLAIDLHEYDELEKVNHSNSNSNNNNNNNTVTARSSNTATRKTVTTTRTTRTRTAKRSGSPKKKKQQQQQSKAASLRASEAARRRAVAAGLVGAVFDDADELQQEVPESDWDFYSNEIPSPPPPQRRSPQRPGGGGGGRGRGGGGRGGSTASGRGGASPPGFGDYGTGGYRPYGSSIVLPGEEVVPYSPRGSAQTLEWAALAYGLPMSPVKTGGGSPRRRARTTARGRRIKVVTHSTIPQAGQGETGEQGAQQLPTLQPQRPAGAAGKRSKAGTKAKKKKTKGVKMKRSRLSSSYQRSTVKSSTTKGSTGTSTRISRTSRSKQASASASAPASGATSPVQHRPSRPTKRASGQSSPRASPRGVRAAARQEGAAGVQPSRPPPRKTPQFRGKLQPHTARVPRDDGISPGPGSYNTEVPSLRPHTASFTFGTTPRDPTARSTDARAFKGPKPHKPRVATADGGPRAASHGDMSAFLGPDRSYLLSNFTRSASFSFGSAARGEPGADKADLPGPGDYGSGPQARRLGGGVIPRAPREPKAPNADVPGPGAYAADSSRSTSPRIATAGSFTRTPRVNEAEEKRKAGAPGPGSYESNAELTIQGSPRKLSRGVSFSMAARTSKEAEARAAEAPGPGSYNVGDSSPNRFASSRSAAPPAFGFSRSSRNLKAASEEVPGPGAYDPHRSLTIEDKIARSPGKGGTMTSAARDDAMKTYVPGMPMMGRDTANIGFMSAHSLGSIGRTASISSVTNSPSASIPRASRDLSAVPASKKSADLAAVGSTAAASDSMATAELPAVGKQVQSRKSTAPSFGFGTSSRDKPVLQHTASFRQQGSLKAVASPIQ